MLETYNKQSYAYLFDALVDDVIWRGKPILNYTAAEGEDCGNCEINWPNGEPHILQKEIDPLIAALVNESEEWSEFIMESPEYDSMQSFLAKAFRGDIGAPQLGHSVIKAARKYHTPRIREQLREAIEYALVQKFQERE